MINIKSQNSQVINEELQQKVDRAIKLIQSAGKIAKMHGQQLEICYSGGKDSDVILELARMSGISYRAIYKNTTIDPPGTIDHARKMGCEVMQPKKTFRELMEENGMPSRWRRFCCRFLKVMPTLFYSKPKSFCRCSRGKYRSRTFPQLAKAIAEQWGQYILDELSNTNI